MDPNANHVLQRVVELMRPGAIQFVVEEVLGHNKGIPDLAKHRYGCRVLERLIEHFPPHSLEQLIDEILSDLKSLLGHPFGNFVVQHLLEHGDDLCKREIVRNLCQDTEELKTIAGHQYACSVLDKALSYGHVEDQVTLAK